MNYINWPQLITPMSNQAGISPNEACHTNIVNQQGAYRAPGVVRRDSPPSRSDRVSFQRINIVRDDGTVKSSYRRVYPVGTQRPEPTHGQGTSQQDVALISSQKTPMIEKKGGAKSANHSPRLPLRQSPELGSFFHITECPICMEKYHNDEGKPKILGCGHTFCQMCLVELTRGSTVDCPTCRKRIFLQHGVAGLPTNHCVLGLLECCCDDCKEHPKTLNCPHCESAICSRCSPSHLDLYKVATTTMVVKLEELYERANGVMQSCNEEHLRKHVTRLRQIVEQRYRLIIERMQEQEKKSLDRLDVFLENVLENLDVLKEDAQKELQHSDDFIRNTRQNLKDNSSFEELAHIQDSVDAFSEGLEKVLTEVKPPTEMVTLQRQELNSTIHRVIINVESKGKGVKRSLT